MQSWSNFSEFLFGKPLPTSAQSHERLGNFSALAILSSDALSSVAYATEAILSVLIVAGSTALTNSFPISLTIGLLLTILILSYRQTIKAYPQGGGAYTVAKENLGTYPGLVAGASLLIDYILTVTVSVAAGVDALTSAYSFLAPHKVLIGLVCILLLSIANLRGVREAGRIFMVPTYSFIFSIFLLLGLGFFKQSSGQITPEVHNLTEHHPLTWFVLLHAFAEGCTALTGVEAISNGVMLFKKPEWKNARTTLIYMGLILGLMFIGLTHLIGSYNLIPQANGQTVISQLGRAIFGGGPLYYVLQYATLLILILAANTSYADFPRLSSLVAKDGFLPRQLSHLGDRLVFSNGIKALSVFAAVLLIIFKGNVNSLLPLYAVGVYTSFTLSQSGMVAHWFKEKGSGWIGSSILNGLGALTTLVVLAVIILTKFKDGAWVVVIAIPLVVLLFVKIHDHYQESASLLRLKSIEPIVYPKRAPLEGAHNTAIVLVGQMNKGTIEAIKYAFTIADEVKAVHVDIGSSNLERIKSDWAKLQIDVPIDIVESPYRSVVRPLTQYIESWEREHPNSYSTVILPVFVTKKWWEAALHNQTALFLRVALRTRERRVVSTFRYYL